MSQCLVLTKYLPGAAGLKSLAQERGVCVGGAGGTTLKSSPPTSVVSRPMTYTADPFTI